MKSCVYLVASSALLASAGPVERRGQMMNMENVQSSAMGETLGSEASVPEQSSNDLGGSSDVQVISLNVDQGSAGMGGLGMKSPAGMPGQGMPGQGMPGQGMPGQGTSGQGMPDLGILGLGNSPQSGGQIPTKGLEALFGGGGGSPGHSGPSTGSGSPGPTSGGGPEPSSGGSEEPSSGGSEEPSSGDGEEPSSGDGEETQASGEKSGSGGKGGSSGGKGGSSGGGGGGGGGGSMPQDKKNPLPQGEGDYEKDMLMYHNWCRQRHGAQDLKWSKKLVAQAQKNADANPSGQMQHGQLEMNGKRVGQNLAGGGSSGGGGGMGAGVGMGGSMNVRRDAKAKGKSTSGSSKDGRESVWMWYAEKKDHQGGGEKLDHFSQVVWKGTKEVGCVTTKTSGGGTYTVCDYYPAGNMQGAYSKNVQPQDSEPKSNGKKSQSKKATGEEKETSGKTKHESED